MFGDLGSSREILEAMGDPGRTLRIRGHGGLTAGTCRIHRGCVSIIGESSTQ